MKRVQITEYRLQSINCRAQIFVWCILFVICNLLIGILHTTPCLAADINFEVTADSRRVSVGSSTQLNLNFYGTQDIPRPDLPDIEGFNWRYIGPSTKLSIINGKVSSSVTHMYRLLPLKTGTFTIPSLTVDYKGKSYTSNPITIEVVQGRAGQQPSAGREEAPEGNVQNLHDRIFLIMQLDKRQAYVNEVVPLTIKLYVNKLAARDIQYPEFAHEGFAVGEFSKPRQYREVLGGITYEVIEFNTTVFAMRDGKLKLGPAELKCNLIVKKESEGRGRSSLFDDDFFGSDFFDDFFTRYESYPITLKSVDIPLTILPLPQVDIPDDFDGAVGDYQLFVQAEPKEVKVGDPITVKMTVAGEGNFKTVKLPSVEFSDDFKVYEPEVKQNETVKIFEQVVIPKNENVKEIPEVSFSFFDTKPGKYKRITRGPIPIEVKPLAKGEEPKIFEIPAAFTQKPGREEVLGRDIIYIKDTPGKLRLRDGFLYKNRLFIAVQFIPIAAVISVLVFYRRKERLETDIRYARRLRASGKARKNLLQVRRFLDSKQTGKFFDAVFKTLQEYLGDKFHLPTAGITSDVTEKLKFNNINQATLEKLKECFNDCDRARYAPQDVTRQQMLGTFKSLGEIIDEFERMKT